MEENRKGLCNNFGNCSNADSKSIVEVPIAADFICPICERELLEVKDKKRVISPKLIGIGVLVLALVGGGYGIYYYKKAKAVVTITTQVVDGIKNAIDSASSNTSAAPIKENDPAPPTSTPATSTSTTSHVITATSLEEGFEKLRDLTIDANARVTYSDKFITQYFVNKNTPVVELGANGTQIGNQYTIQDIVDKTLTGNCAVVVERKEENQNKISKLFVRVVITNGKKAK